MKFFTGSIETLAEEPEPDDELSFEIITDEEIANLTSAFSISMSLSSSPSSASISSQSSSSSSGSTSSKDSSSSLGSAGYGSTVSLSEDELTSSVRIWYLIQVKGHHHDEDDLMVSQHLGTMEESSMKRTGWFFNLLHLHEKIRQNAADKKRFNINSIPEAIRQQLKHMYVY